VSGYRISPSGVESVLKKTQADAEKFGEILKPMQDHVESAATATGGSGAIIPALQAFFENQSSHLDTINRRVTAALTGAVDATKAYMDGDLEMVAEYQRNAETDALPTPVMHGRNVLN
jgi:hypothetical protein